MKTAWYKTLLSITGVLILFSCGEKNKPADANNNKLFTEDPTLKNITDKINEDPDNARLYYERGLVLHRMHEDSLALFDFNSAVKFDSTKAEYYSAIGDLFFEHKDLSGSLKWIRKAIELNPGDPKAHMKVAKMHVYTRDYPTAFSEINKVLKEDAMNPEAYFLKGIIYKDIKDTTDKALSSFLTAVQIQPDYKDALMQIGLIYDQKNDSVALRYYENAFRADTNDVSPLYAKGMYYQVREKFEKAKDEYKRCVGVDRNFSDAYFSTGYILMQQDSLEKAYRQFDLVIKLEPTNPKAYYNRGLCSELMDEREKATSDYKQAVTFDKGYKEALEGLKRLKK